MLEKILAKVKSSAEKALDVQSLNQSSSQEKNTKTKGKVIKFLNWLPVNYTVGVLQSHIHLTPSIFYTLAKFSFISLLGDLLKQLLLNLNYLKYLLFTFILIID